MRIDGRVERLDGVPAVQFDRTLHAKPAEVFAAISDPERVGAWFAPLSGELQTGGEFELGFSPDYRTTGTVLACEPGVGVSFTWAIDDRDFGAVDVALGRTITDHTELTLVHHDLPEDQWIGYAAGWHAHLDVLAAYLAGETLVWDDVFAQTLPAYRSLVQD
jgi:uncharacterized protein YndB with AHSA1/START domain